MLEGHRLCNLEHVDLIYPIVEWTLNFLNFDLVSQHFTLLLSLTWIISFVKFRAQKCVNLRDFQIGEGGLYMGFV